MISYSSMPIRTIARNEIKIESFVSYDEKNLDKKTVKSFGEEWEMFKNFSENEIKKIGDDYFDLLPRDITSLTVLDVGCGSGRWSYYLAPRVKFIEAIDPSSSVFVAGEMLKNYMNVRVTQASVENLPFPDNSFDLIYSLGVLHHVPDTLSAIKKCSQKLKKDGLFLLYLYYNLENRGLIFKLIFQLSNRLRKWICTLPASSKKLVCNTIAGMIYWPLARFSLLISVFSIPFATKIPLSYYRKTSFFIMRNDAMDRFGTPLEKRFSKQEIANMLEKAGFNNIVFSPSEPYWHVLSQKS